MGSLKFTHIKDGKISMVDVTEKRDVKRTATAEGFIRLRRETVEAIRKNEVEKGDVISAAIIAGVMGVKKTPELIPLCHQLNITGVDVDVKIEEDGLRVILSVSSVGKTGVEMEALTGVSCALLTIWDMVKSMEKDETGNYPETWIEKIRVVEKRKEG
ncbi:MAG: cyclic pyranopterin monophosphate synthase [Archaeoglobi archaeon]|nr:cyclic pyranopterin monophosphate synthase MoaC [Candidatus Mnemosynella bozhongmuii]MDI3502857.1 cyclic pyranopterin monophosphate synthase [Archaeoglobi archaeon]MDK2781680.1 cyclic pyranopterin monophosphate synthase [Archaeoglobi archaeon]